MELKVLDNFIIKSDDNNFINRGIWGNKTQEK